ncbi:hypothetical protein MMPV_008352 [Pyropia vietnamensis]
MPMRWPRAPPASPAGLFRRHNHRLPLRQWGALVVAAIVLAFTAVATAPHGADGAFSVRPLPTGQVNGGGTTPTSATPSPSGSTPRELPSAVALDATGAVFVAGTSRVAASTAAGGSSGVFLLKASPLGNVLWRSDVASSGGLDSLGGLVVAPSGVYLAVTTNGRFEGPSGDGNGSGGAAEGSGGRAGASSADGESFYDGALLCFSPDAAAPPQWTYQNGTAAADAYTAIAVRPKGKGRGGDGGAGGTLVVAGWTRGAQFDAASGGRDVVVLEFNVTAGDGGGVAQPTLAHGVQWGTALDEQASALAIADDGTVYVAVQQTIGVGHVAGDAGDGGRAFAADGTADAAVSAGDGMTRDRLVVYALDGRLARRLAADGTVAPGMEILAQSSFVVACMTAGDAGRVYAAGVASVADGRRDDALLALFNLTSPSSSSAGEGAAATLTHKAVVVWNESAPAASERAVSVMVERGGSVVLVGHVRDPTSGAVSPWVMVYNPLGRLVYEDTGGSAGGSGGGGGVSAGAMEPRSCALDIARTSFFCVGLLRSQSDAAEAGVAAFGRYDWTVALPSAEATAASLGAGGGGAVTGNGVSGDSGNTSGDVNGGGALPGDDGESSLDGFLSKRLNVLLLLVGAVLGGLLVGGAAVGTLLTLGHRRRDADKVVAESSYFASEVRGSPKGSGGSGSSSAAAGSSVSVVPGGGNAWHGGGNAVGSSGLPVLPSLFTASGAPSGDAKDGSRPGLSTLRSAPIPSTADGGGSMSRTASARTFPRPPSAIDKQLVGSASFFSVSGAVPGGGGGGGGGRGKGAALSGGGTLMRHATHSGAMPSGGGGGLSRIDSELSVGSRTFFKK